MNVPAWVRWTVLAVVVMAIAVGGAAANMAVLGASDAEPTVGALSARGALPAIATGPGSEPPPATTDAANDDHHDDDEHADDHDDDSHTDGDRDHRDDTTRDHDDD